MEKGFEINHHEESLSACDLCGRQFIVQKGGQKSGKPPVVRIIGGKAEYYCSSRCLAYADGVSYEDTLGYKVLKSFGLEPEEIFYPGYLAPARRINFTPTPS